MYYSLKPLLGSYFANLGYDITKGYDVMEDLSHISTNYSSPRYDIEPVDNATIITMEVPGYKQGDIGISVDKNDLIITGTISYREKENNFCRIWALNGNYEKDNITAQLEHGILTITIPYKKETVNEVRKIPINVP